MNFYDIISGRRSVRSYKKEPVEDDKVNRILEAARLAPSAANMQPVCFVVIRDENKKLQLKEAYNEEWFYTAPVIICVCSNSKTAWKRGDGKNYADIDAAIAMDHLILAATIEGLGTCWVAAFKVYVVRSVLNLPPELEPVAMTPVGYPLDIPEPTYRKSFKEIVKFI